jgi:hypothetical protein
MNTARMRLRTVERAAERQERWKSGSAGVRSAATMKMTTIECLSTAERDGED